MLRAAAASAAVDRLDKFQQRAFAMLTSSKTRDAFDLSREPDRVRDRYGRNLYGSSLLVGPAAGRGRRAVRQRAPGDLRHYGHSYDMHENNFGMLKDHNLPILDQVVPGADRGPGRAAACSTRRWWS